MSFRTFSRLLVTILFPLAFICTTYLYLYPLFHGCAFPVTTASRAAAQRDALTQHWPLNTFWSERQQRRVPPFRLLVLADPQLEGDSSLPNPEDGFFRRLDRHIDHVFASNTPKAQRKLVIKKALRELLFSDIPQALKGLRKQLDLFGNDYYLAHIFRTLHWWTRPSHVTVLGDLLGSQWVTDEEYESRAWRYWKRVFDGGHRVEDALTASSAEDAGRLDTMRNQDINERAWSDRIINIAGNHDIGYAGDISKARIARFEKHFGRADWDIRLSLPAAEAPKNPSITPSLHLIVLNDLILDTPGFDPEIQSSSYEHLNSIITHRSHPVEDESTFTLLLTHVPLHKPAGTCVDPPFFDFHGSDDPDAKYRLGGLKEQNHLSEHVSRSGILEGIYGMSANPDAAGNGKGRQGLILTGHDHEGCDVWHHLPLLAGETSAAAPDGDGEHFKSEGWHSIPWRDANTTASHTGVREITLRSMMGEYGGNAGLLSIWFDFEKHGWRYEMQMCQLGVQHIWWGIHALDCITVAVAILWLVSSCLGASSTPPGGIDVSLTSGTGNDKVVVENQSHEKCALNRVESRSRLSS
jgi:hypothetical protein